MRYYLALWTVLIALTPISWGAADEIQSLAPLDTLPAATVVSEYVQRIRDTYEVLRNSSWIRKSFADSIREIHDLRTSLFQTQIPYEPLPDEKNLILTLRFIKFNIKSMSVTIGSFLYKLKY